MSKFGMAAVAALTIAGTIAASTSGAEARYYGRGGYHGGYYRGGGYGIGAGIATGLANYALVSGQIACDAQHCLEKLTDILRILPRRNVGQAGRCGRARRESLL